MSDVNKLKTEIKELDQQKFQLLTAMKEIEEAKSMGDMLKEELDKLKQMQTEEISKKAGLKRNQEIITWHTFYEGEPECPIKKSVLIQTKNGDIKQDMLSINTRTYRMEFSSGRPNQEVIAWAELPKGI